MLVSLGGCATFGGNVKGSFSCAAPDGICAPSSSIDDRALAMISGDASEGSATPAGPYLEGAPKARATRTAALGSRTPLQQVSPGRTQERVLRIVFQPYIDERGRLHESSAVHAVVETGQWQQQALASATPIPDRNAVAALQRTETLAEALDRADPPGAVVASIDPNLPDPAVVQAARARQPDPVAAIKADVAARFAHRAEHSPPASQLQPASKPTGRDAGRPGSGPLVASSAIASPPSVAGSSGAEAAVPLHPANPATSVRPSTNTKSGAEAQALVKADPRYQSAARSVEEEAQQASIAKALPDAKPSLKATVRAAGFPADLPEDN